MNALQMVWEEECRRASDQGRQKDGSRSGGTPDGENTDEKERYGTEKEEKHGAAVCLLAPEDIVPNPHRPRRRCDENAMIRLADSIRRYGILQPLTVRRTADPSKFELVSGERRLQASVMLHFAHIPCYILEADERRGAEIALIGSLQQEKLNMFEQAEAITALAETCRMTQEQIARCLCASQSYVANKLRLLRLTDGERETVLRCGLTERHVRALLRITDPVLRKNALEKVAQRGMTVASAENYVDKLLAEAGKRPVRELEYQLLRRDIRLFYNTVDRAVETVRQAGIGIVSDRREDGDDVEMTIRIRHPYRGVS